MESGSRRAVERVWASVVADPRHALEETLDPSDLNTLLMALSRVRASEISPARLMQRWAQDRFVRPSSCDPRDVWRVEGRLWDLLPGHFDGIDLSPVAPLATCSAVAPVDQNIVISTTRGTEVVSDPTNVLAMEAALRRKRDPPRAVHLAACHRVVRAQPVHGQGRAPHFRLFVLVSSERDHGSGATEAEMLTSHLRYWISAVNEIAPHADVVTEFSPFESPVLQERFTDTVVSGLQPLPRRSTLHLGTARRRARGYYSSGAMRIQAAGVEIGDGGFTDWTARLMADKKERCLISCIATERLTALAEAQPPTSNPST